MQQTGTPAPVSRDRVLGKLFHWGFVAIFAYGIYKQVDNISQLADGALLRFEVIFAALFLILLGARFFYMSRMQSSALPENTLAVQKLGAKVVHYEMYVSMG
jgi:cytochrome b561